MLVINSITTLVICVYFTTDYGNSEAHDLFAETLSELSGFIDSQPFDNIIVACNCDFNVDFSRPGVNHNALSAFMSDFDLCAADLPFESTIGFTYERDDGLVRSWPDHILVSFHHSHHIHGVNSSCNLSDHLSVCSQLSLDLSPLVLGIDTISFQSAADSIDLFLLRMLTATVSLFNVAFHQNCFCARTFLAMHTSMLSSSAVLS